MHYIDKLIESVEGGTLYYGIFSDSLNIPCQDMKYAINDESVWRAYNGSLDAAKALHDAVLPGWPVRVMDHSQDYLGGHGWHVCVNWPHMEAPKGKAAYPADSYSYTAWAHDPARAWLIAILKAYRSKVQE